MPYFCQTSIPNANTKELKTVFALPKDGAPVRAIVFYRQDAAVGTAFPVFVMRGYFINLRDRRYYT
jgi:hypothetical protein